MNRKLKFLALIILLFYSVINPLASKMIFKGKYSTTMRVRQTENSIWNAWLSKNVSRSGFVKYYKGRRERFIVREYLQYLLRIRVKSLKGNNNKLAYYINLYNALTVYQVLTNYPMKSVMKKFPDGGFFKNTFYLNKKLTSLNDLEKKIILPQFKQPLVHFALNCASKSCPPLSRYAYYGRGLTKRLKKAAARYMKNKNFVQIDKKAKTLKMIELFDWYKKDFGDLKTFYTKYTKNKIDISDYKIEFIPYDWSLNGR